ncbi:FlgN family protein [Thermaerobacter marianensis DSM 12885]|uniref:FlgN family protein n=1 Tax=Thermaerobacter marianensis (strain ATCC 700841 / DSM 12885 / JCM 10246 / 7p75a) TaxID=644966 RepID=E6SLQ1_THEM7|nr:flagellar protein FlgN [Thermaerobacter marianensis]ADU50318.1 FlgN family protein [Thermaerobacter marianensis DSM 12885]
MATGEHGQAPGTEPAAATTNGTAATATVARDLVALLSAQVEPWARLLEAARTKGRALVAGDVAAVESALVEENRWLEQIQRLEERRYQLQRDLATRWGLDARDLTWDELARRCPELGPQLGRLRQALRALVEGVDAVNRENRSLAQQGLAWARFALKTLVAGSGAAAPAYGRDGQRQWRPAGLSINRAY